jgi:hypothetical protein
LNDDGGVKKSVKPISIPYPYPNPNTISISHKNDLNNSGNSSVHSPILISRQNSISQISGNRRIDSIIHEEENVLVVKNNLNKNLKEAVVNRNKEKIYSKSENNNIMGKSKSKSPLKNDFTGDLSNTGLKNSISGQFSNFQNNPSNKDLKRNSQEEFLDSNSNEDKHTNLTQQVNNIGVENWDQFRKLDRREKIVKIIPYSNNILIFLNKLKSYF